MRDRDEAAYAESKVSGKYSKEHHRSMIGCNGFSSPEFNNSQYFTFPEQWE